MEELHKQELQVKVKAELISLDKNIKELEEVTKPISPDNALGRLTRMDAINNKAVNDSILVKSRTRREALQKVLDNLDTPGFGICGRCQQPIPHLRLMHVPEAKVCVKCSSKR